MDGYFKDEIMNDQLGLVCEDQFFHSRELHDNTPFLNLLPAPEVINTDNNNELPDLLGARNLETECC
jgi:hypothetical protein